MARRNISSSGLDITAQANTTADELSDLFKKVCADLKTNAAISERQKDLFFPNGIELIELSISVGMTARGVEVKLKVAGEKGVKAGLAEDPAVQETAQDVG